MFIGTQGKCTEQFASASCCPVEMQWSEQVRVMGERRLCCGNGVGQSGFEYALE